MLSHYLAPKIPSSSARFFCGKLTQWVRGKSDVWRHLSTEKVFAVLFTDHCHQGESDSVPYMYFPTKKCHCFSYFSSRLCFLPACKQPHMWVIYFFDGVRSFPCKFCGTSFSFSNNDYDILPLKIFQRNPMGKWPLLKHSACYPIYSAMHVLETEFAFHGVIWFSKLIKLHSARIWLVGRCDDFALCAR